MIKRIIFLSSILVAAAMVLLVSPVLAKNDNNSDDEWVAPEQNGTYDVPGRPDLKVRVFVHNPKNSGKPAPEPEVLGICSTDANSNAPVGTTGWKLPAEWNYRLNISTVPSSIGAVGLENIANLSFTEWYKNMPGMNMTEGSNTNKYKASLDGQNIIAWGNAPGSALAVTYTWYNRTTGEVAENDTIMNKKFAWSWNMCSTKSYDAQNILTHELGHWLGLNDHYKEAYVNNTMYGYGSTAENKKDTLTAGDIAGINAIY
jgi:hypothetical protein